MFGATATWGMAGMDPLAGQAGARPAPKARVQTAPLDIRAERDHSLEKGKLVVSREKHRGSSQENH